VIFSTYYSADTIENAVYDYLDVMEKDGIISAETLVNVWEWDTQTYQIFLEVDSTFTFQQAQILQNHINNVIHERILVSLVRVGRPTEGPINTPN
jgi:hypothetical protein